jgi:hypothetical protein
MSKTHPGNGYLESWDSEVQIITLRKPLRLHFNKTNQGVDAFCRNPQLVGSGSTREKALEMLFDHLLIDYYEFSLNPGPQSEEDECYGRKLKLIFNAEKNKY